MVAATSSCYRRGGVGGGLGRGRDTGDGGGGVGASSIIIPHFHTTLLLQFLHSSLYYM